MVTYKDLAQLLGVTETTIKSYRKKFPLFLKPENRGKPLRFPGICASVCTRIRDSFANGLSVEETRAVLVDEFPHLLPPKHGLTSHGNSASADMPEAESSASGHPASSSHTPGTADLAPIVQILAQGLDRVAAAQEELAKTMASGLDQLREQLSAQLQGVVQHQTAAPLPDSLAGPMSEFLARSEQRDTALQQTLESLTSSMHSLLLETRTQGLSQDTDSASTTDHTATPQPAAEKKRKRVNVTNPQGQVSSYVLETRDSDADIEDAPRSLPLVLRSERGEYLGVGGRAMGTLSLEDLAAMADSVVSPEEPYGATWNEEGGSATLCLQNTQSRYELTANTTTTPRGNKVAELTGLTVDGKQVATGFAVTFVRRLREQLDATASPETD